MSTSSRIVSSFVMFLVVLAVAASLALWKGHVLRQAEAAALAPSEASERVTVTAVRASLDHPTTTAIGTVLALRSVTLRNELAGTVRRVALQPGRIVEAGSVLVELDVDVERAELAAQEARAALAETTLARLERLIAADATSTAAVEQARAARDVARADIARIQALIERKTVRAPFRARVGLADVHPGQYLDAGTTLTSLQAVADAVHVDFAVPQEIAADLARDAVVEVVVAPDGAARRARVVAVDARVDAETRNATVRARLAGAGADLPAPGASVQVRVPTGPARPTLIVPATALRKGPDGDHVFVVAATPDRGTRAQLRRVRTGTVSGEAVQVLEGLDAGEQVATSGSFKLRDGMRVEVADATRH